MIDRSPGVPEPPESPEFPGICRHTGEYRRCRRGVVVTSDHPAIEKARELINAGAFARAEALIGIGANFEGEAGRRTRDESLETIRRIRREYDQTEADLVAAVRKTIDDFTAEDLRRLVDEGQVVCRMIDGEMHYFRREPGVMTRFSDEIKRRTAEWDAKRKAESGDAGTAPSKPMDEDRANFTLNNHLAEVAQAGLAAPRQARHRS